MPSANIQRANSSDGQRRSDVQTEQYAVRCRRGRVRVYETCGDELLDSAPHALPNAAHNPSETLL